MTNASVNGFRMNGLVGKRSASTGQPVFRATSMPTGDVSVQVAPHAFPNRLAAPAAAVIFIMSRRLSCILLLDIEFPSYDEVLREDCDGYCASGPQTHCTRDAT